MRHALVLLVLLSSLSLAACGKKKSPTTPIDNADTQAAPDGEGRVEQDQAKPDDPDSDAAQSADPCEGGE